MATSARDVRDMWNRGVRATRQDRQQAAVNHAFLRNKQWVFWNTGSGRLEEYPREPSRVRATVPRIGPDSRRIIAKLVRRGLVFDVPPSSPDDAAIRASRIGEAALLEAQRDQRWESIRLDHAWACWEAGVAGLCVEWDQRKGNPVAMDERGRAIGTGDVSLSCLSLHEIACEPGTRDIESSFWWIRGVALPPPEARKLYGLANDPAADARALDQVWRMGDESNEATPLTMVFTYYGRPHDDEPGEVITVVGEQIVDQGPWPFPFTDRLNLATAVVNPIHGRWLGVTPVADGVGVQALYNASWSSIVEHMKLAGNARLWVPMGTVEDIEVLTDTPGEIVEYNPIAGAGKPEYEAPPVMPDWWIRQPMMLEQALDDIMGVHDISRGEAPSGIESGVALSILSENDDTPVGAMAKSLAECWGRAASMVLGCWEVYVSETRQSMVHLPGGVPEVIQWSGADLMGQTTAVVPLDSVMPRSRAAQAAYALQLYDRKVITNPADLAKVADLPDQDDLLAGIDPDTARAQRENYWMSVGSPRLVEEFDDHANHMSEHRDFMRSERYELSTPEIQQLFQMHQAAHEQYAAAQAAVQAQASALDPVAGAVPTAATKPIDAEALEQTAAIGAASLPRQQLSEMGNAVGPPPNGGPPPEGTPAP